MTELKNPLQRYPSVRQGTYDVYWVVGILIGALTAGWAVLDGGLPTAIIVANAVWVWVGTVLNFQARQNISSETEL